MSGDCLCSSDAENGNRAYVLNKLLTSSSSVPDSYISYEDRSLDRKKRSASDDQTWFIRPINPVQFKSSFTPRLGRRDRQDSIKWIKPRAQVISMNAGSAFTPRLGRRSKSYY